jgi:hypothetical protein
MVSANGICIHRSPMSVPAPMTCAAPSSQATGIQRCALRHRRAPMRLRA